MTLSVDKGRVTARDRDGNVVGEPRAAAEVLAGAGDDSPLETVVLQGERPAGEVTPPRSLLDDLPGELSAPEWRALEEIVEWSPGHGAFCLRSDAEIFSAAELFKNAREIEEAPSASPAHGPEKLGDFDGPSRVLDDLLLAARAARGRGEVLGHVLLSGLPGLGKTTLARRLARECGGGIEEVVAAGIRDPYQLVSLLVRLKPGQFLFLDEVHALDRACEESLYSALAERCVNVLLREHGRTRTLRVRLEPFTLVAATTRLGALSEPFRSRFAHRERLEPYSERELCELVTRAAVKLGTEATEEAAHEVARRSRGTPREAIRLLERSRDVAQVASSGESAHVVVKLDADHVVEAASRLGIDERGLGREEQAVIELLVGRGRPLGLAAIAARLGIDLDTLREVYEPWLERCGLTERTERGRVATEEARMLYGGRGNLRPRGRGIPILPLRLAG
jgi:Holliday junction DNA helicase RuvB